MVSNVKSIREYGKVIISLFFLILISRLPFITNDYGSDPDAYRVANTAYHLSNSIFDYSASRLPGYPVHEFSSSLLIKFGHYGTNGLTLILSTTACIIFMLILIKMRFRSITLTTLAFSFTPVIYINSTCTMDYMWALLFILTAWYFILIKKLRLAGFFLGLAIGCRITSGFMLFPYIFYLFQFRSKSEVSIKEIFAFILVTLSIGTLCFLPVFIKYNLEFFTFYEHGYSLRSAINISTIGVWGTIGFVFILFILQYVVFFQKKISDERPALLSMRRLFIDYEHSTYLIVISLYLIVFFRLPHEAGYLIPAIPFFIMLLSRLTIKNHDIFKVFCIGLFLSSFVEISSSGIYLGPIFQDYKTRVSADSEATEIISRVKLNHNSLIIAGPTLPRLISKNIFKDEVQNNKLIYLITDENEYQEYIEKGYSIFFLPGMDNYNKLIYGIDIVGNGAEKLDKVLRNEK